MALPERNFKIIFQKQNVYKPILFPSTHKMALTNSRSKRKVTGGRYVGYRKKRISEVRNLPTLTKLGEKVARVLRVRGGNNKSRLLSDKVANVFNPTTKKYEKLEIKTVLENPANRNFVRRNILTKGTVIETAKGKAKITSRPGQERVINAILLK